jgi:hypothetical protein
MRTMPCCLIEPGFFFNNHYRGGNHGYHSYRRDTVTVLTGGGNRPDSNYLNLIKK